MSDKIFFSRYLVEHQLVTEDSLVEALLEQLQSSPTIAQLAYRERLFTAKQMLAVFEYQTLKNCEFAIACRDLNLWSKDIETKICKAIEQDRKPLATILIKNNTLDLPTLQKAFESYLNDGAHPEKKQEVSSEKAVSEEGLDSYALIFTSQKASQLSDLINEAFQKNEAEVWNECLKEIRQISGLCRLIKASWSEKIALCLEGAIRRCSQSKQNVQTVFPKIKRAFELLLNLRGEILMRQTETLYLQKHSDEIALVLDSLKQDIGEVK